MKSLPKGPKEVTDKAEHEGLNTLSMGIMEVREEISIAGPAGGNQDAEGPETYTFGELVRMIASQINSRARIVHVRPGMALFLARLTGYDLRDVVLTRDEIEGLMSNLLVSEGHPTAQTRFSEWLSHNADNIGIKYISGLRRSYC